MKSIKLLVASFLMSMVVTSAIASEPIAVQNEAKSVSNETVSDKWFINVAAGTQIMFSDHDKQSTFGKRLAPALDIAVGKWFKPGIGVRLMYSGLSAKGATQDDSYTTGEYLGHDRGWTTVQKINFCNVHADVMFNLAKLLQHKDLHQRWASSPYFGVGFVHVYDSPKKNYASLNLGVYNTIRIIDCLDATVDIRGMFVGDGFDGEKGHRKGEGVLSLSVGLAYNF